jgi:hypothetical protein
MGFFTDSGAFHRMCLALHEFNRPRMALYSVPPARVSAPLAHPLLIASVVQFTLALDIHRKLLDEDG